MNLALWGVLLPTVAGLVWWRPLLVWVLIPALLPLDLAPWTGRLMVDEYDAVLGTGLLVAAARCPSRSQRADRLLTALMVLVVLVYLMGVVRVLWPWPGVAPDAAGNPLGPFNSWRIARGAVWAAAGGWVAWRHHAAGWTVLAHWRRGMVLGLLVTVGFIVVERLAFSSLLDVRDGYRVAGPFAAMHTGGAYVEAFLVAALPFLAAALWPPVRAARWVAGAALLLASVYAVLVTFSRGGYAAAALVLLAMPLLAWQSRRPRLATVALASVLGLAVAAVAVPILSGEFARSRLAAVDTDWAVREHHWAAVAQLADDAGGSLLTGLGVGRLPALALIHGSPALRSGSFQLVDDGAQRLLRLGSGGALYVEQLVSVPANQVYRVSARVRAAGPGTALVVNLCEKWLIASARCQSVSLAPTSPAGTWQVVSALLDSGPVGGSAVWRPVKLSLSLAGPTALDVADLSVVDASGTPLLRNSDFRDGLDHWAFTADNHLAWHAKSLPLGLLFDLGLPGLAVMAALWLLALWRAGQSALAGRADGAALALALLALATVGSIDTLLDSPRFLMLWLLLCQLGCLRPASGGAASTRHPHA